MLFSKYSISILSKTINKMSSQSINQSMSLFVAYVFPNIGLHRIINIFQDANLGVVSRIDFIKKIDKNGKPFNNIYVHFDRWFESEEAQKFQDSIKDPEAKTTLQYDGPWFWIVLENTFLKKKEKEVEKEGNQIYRTLPPVQRRICLDLSEDCVVKQIDSKLIDRITANAKPTQYKSKLFKQHSYWYQPAEELSTSALLAQILKIQQEIAEMKEKVKDQDQTKDELEYLREQNRQLQQELDSIKK
jgi:hypothetical protein